jgi:pyridoxine/pyridoxamine 5'-phosphate oxidase
MSGAGAAGRAGRREEFWQDGAYRLHDRVRFTREGEAWTGNRLYP